MLQLHCIMIGNDTLQQKGRFPVSLKLDLLTVPDNDELAQIIHRPVLARTTLHSWPLSRTERIDTVSGTVILKIQFSCTSVERAFYRQVRHPMVLTPLADGMLADCDYMILPFLEGRPEDWSSLTENEIRARVRLFQRDFLKIEHAPIFIDFSTHEKFVKALDFIHPTLLEGGLSPLEWEALIKWVYFTASACWDVPIGLLHGDLKGDHILPDNGNPVVIDWQRPLYAPLRLEESIALLLESRSPATADAFDALALLYIVYWYAWAYQKCLHIPFVLAMAVKHARKCLATVSAISSGHYSTDESYFQKG